MPYSHEDEEETIDEDAGTEETEDTEDAGEDREENEGGSDGTAAAPDAGGAMGGLNKLNDMLGGAGINLGQLIDDATESKGGAIKTAGDLIGGFLNKDKSE